VKRYSGGKWGGRVLSLGGFKRQVKVIYPLTRGMQTHIHARHSVVEKHVGDISGTDAMEVRMKDEHVIAWLAIGSPSDNQRPTPEHQPIYNNTIYPWYRTTYSWADLMEFPLQ
jgi:hypothetical protein